MFNAIVMQFICMLQLQLVATEGQRGTNRPVFYAVEMDGGVRAARDLAEQHGLEFISRVGSLENVYSLKDSREPQDQAPLEAQLQHTAGVVWLQRQQGFHRDKRFSITQLDASQVHGPPRQQNVTDRRSKKKKKLTDYSPLTFNDPLWPLQWELFAQAPYRSSSLDLNVMPVWKKNITGNGVVVSIIDDGVDYTNEDLKRNFEALASVDLQSSHGLSNDPMPIRDEENGHGTRCAGEIAMEANNSYCGVGIAFNARIGGIRLLGGPVTDAMEAVALTFSPNLIHVYVCSWGPPDNGSELGGPGRLARRALQWGAHKGRHGRGSVFVWASGNGGIHRDHCGADGYVNSVYSIAVGAVTHTGEPAFYGEPCPAIMAVTPTGANPDGSLPLVTVSNLEDGCQTRFPGTSSAAPYAAGILALVLEANPELTWRDLQHLIARTARIPDPSEPGWMINGAGYHVHHRKRVSVVGRFTAPRSGTGGASHASLCGIACGWFYWPLLRGAWMERAVVPGVQE
ncbi:neuroendocrine convertase 1-like [Gadus chalcogrammus]|uniref:neuroendocrine convertase 1-like n=1 Tax=Gadus chalcogrammus TaxID=1042646 RepID=UPI0024C4AB7C|nr:neuroendocrine convertase 1-like [Gadus chalcogrammus]